MCKCEIQIFYGNIIHCPARLKIELIERGYVAVQGKQIIAIGRTLNPDELLYTFNTKNKVKVIHLKPCQILIPGLIDTHIHAPQYPNAGLGYDKTLLDWLNTYTYKLEREYKDLEFAKKVFDAVVKTTLNHGTTTACYFASLYTDASITLVDSVIEHGQRALIGKINMTKSPYDDYVETEEESFENTVKFIQNVVARKSDLVEPILTPRFALSVDLPHMRELGQIARENNLCIQTHISENVDEVRIVEEAFGADYANVYDQGNLLTEKTVLAHGIHLSDKELQLISEKGSSIAHCPASNTCLRSGLCDVKKILDHGIKVGLGTDISGGPDPSICKAMRAALDVSIHLSFQKENREPLTYQDVFYLATLGGAEALSMEDKIGNFVVGKQFDALVVDMNPERGPIDFLYDCTPMELLQKFVYCGDDRNVASVFVAGKDVKS